MIDDLQQILDRESDLATRKGFHIWRIQQDLSEVDFIIEGPLGSFYEGTVQSANRTIRALFLNDASVWALGSHAGGLFVLRVWFPQDYPNRSFSCCMLTPLYHPTVTPDGRVAFPRARANWFDLLTVAEYLEHLHGQLKLYDFSQHPKGLTFTRLLECPEVILPSALKGFERRAM